MLKWIHAVVQRTSHGPWWMLWRKAVPGVLEKTCLWCMHCYAGHAPLVLIRIGVNFRSHSASAMQAAMAVSAIANICMLSLGCELSNQDYMVRPEIPGEALGRSVSSCH